MNILFAKIKFFKYTAGMGDKIIGFLYSECYADTVYAFVFWNRGIMLVVKGR